MTTRPLGLLGRALLLTLVACGGSPASEPPAAADPAPGAAGAAERPFDLGPGFVVWESNRTGVWRIWIRGLDGSPPRQLSPDERGRVHCCAHIAPDGARIAYLSVRGSARQYNPEGPPGELHLIAPDGSGDRVVAPAARNYFENRAVVWRGPDELIHIDGERATVALDLERGRSRRLAPAPAEHGWLIDPTLGYATTGLPTFSVYDAGARRVVPRRQLGGCQPYFTRDGRWGIWAAGAGGPLEGLDLASRERTRILDKSDPRVPGGYGYAYFPMLSADGRLFAWGASRGEHDHFRADYEVFVAESDPDTLELVGAPLRVTHDPAVDRFPDVWQPPLELGRHAGEAPLTARLEAPGGGEWSWSLGDGATASGAVAEHTWSTPGRYEIAARRGEAGARGVVVVRPAAPPRPLGVTTLAGGSELVVRFDEPVDPAGATAELASGRRVTGIAAGEAERSLRLTLAAPVSGPDRLELAGVRDRAQRPNPMAPATLTVEPPAWPATRDGLLFLWQSADAANLVADPELGGERAYTLTAVGDARLDAAFTMVLDGGSFALPAAEAAPIANALQAANEMSLELTVTPRGSDGPIVAMADGRNSNFWLHQRGGLLAFGVRIGPRGREAFPELTLPAPAAGRTAHLVVTYSPGRLTAWVGGEPALDSQEIQGDFYHWRGLPLVFGGGGWSGRVEGVAIYDRVLSEAEVREANRLYRAALAAREPVPRTVVEARLLERSPPPTLEEISPYREALVTARWAVESWIEGAPGGDQLRVAQWAIVDGRTLPLAGAAAGSRYRLTLEPFASQPQLEAVYIADTLGGGDGAGELFYAAAATPLD